VALEWLGKRVGEKKERKEGKKEREIKAKKKRESRRN
jgi:hypothetical protein